jgi:CRISPR/Cas system-associated exonuclease Cas4 (RecB family)
LAIQGSPLDSRDRLVIVPTRAAAEHLVRGIEHSSPSASILPDFATASEIVRRFADRLPFSRPQLSGEEREVLLRVACRAVIAEGIEPPFRVRPGLVAEMLRFFDDLRRNQKDVETFERLALGILEPGAAEDRGAHQLVQQTRFLAAVFRVFARRCAQEGDDEHELRRQICSGTAPRPYRHVVVTVGDRTVDVNGLAPVDWDLLARTPGIERLDVLVTDRVLAGTLHERIHSVLPGIEEQRFESLAPVSEPTMCVPDHDHPVYVTRDREEEVAAFAREVKRALRDGRLSTLDRAALVVHQPLPYVYLARTVLGSAGLQCQLFDTLPLAAEPYAGALDLVLTFVGSGFARAPGIQLLQSPHFDFADPDGHRISAGDISVLDRALTENGYTGDVEALGRLIDAWNRAQPPRPAVIRAGRLLEILAHELAPLRAPAPVAEHLTVLLRFLTAHETMPWGSTDPGPARHLRARGAVIATIASLLDAHRRFDDGVGDFDEVAALLRRWIESQTFAPRTGSAGVHVLDSASAPFGHFEFVHCAGLVDGEWPERPRRNIFYSTAILREFGWPAERDRTDGLRSSFSDLLGSATREVHASAFLLEHDAIVSLSPFVDEISRRERTQAQAAADTRIFDHEALTAGDIAADVVGQHAREWAAFRQLARSREDARFRGATGSHLPHAYSLSGLERYQDCPFKYFASDVLRLDEPAEDGGALSPRARGRFIHELLHQFFQAWDARAEGAMTPARLDTARAVFAEVAEPLLSQLPRSDAALERTRLFGSALSVGIVDLVLAMEVSRPGTVRERWLEYRLEGEFSLGDSSRRVPLRGVADRIDLLEGNRLRVIDYKTGSAPERGRALQVPVYALCAQERLEARDGSRWAVDEALYISFSGKRASVRIADAQDDEMLASARNRVFTVVDQINAGVFPVRPHEPIRCSYCAYPSVCRKDYVE